jgi:hypothetical protein
VAVVPPAYDEVFGTACFLKLLKCFYLLFFKIERVKVWVEA